MYIGELKHTWQMEYVDTNTTVKYLLSLITLIYYLLHFYIRVQGE